MKKILILIAILANFTFAKDMYVFDIKANLIDPETKDVVGEIYEGTPVKFVKAVDEFSLVEVKGEIAQDNEKVLALTKDPFLTFLMFKDAKYNKQTKFLIETKKLTNNQLEAWEEVDLFYYDSCSSCHAAHKPKEHIMGEWDAYLTAMQTFAKISDEEKARILRYLQAYAQDGVVKE